MQKVSGVYKITNTITGDFYIGSSKDIKRRWANHKSPSTWAISLGMSLYQAFINYGLNNFTFEIIEETDNLKKREQYWIDQLKPNYNDRRADGFNIERFRDYYRDHYKSNKEYWNTYQNKYQGRLCLYNSEILTLGTLYHRLRKCRIDHPFREAKNYLIR